MSWPSRTWCGALGEALPLEQCHCGLTNLVAHIAPGYPFERSVKTHSESAQRRGVRGDMGPVKGRGLVGLSSY